MTTPSSPQPSLPPTGDLRLPSLDALRGFEAAARLGTFERAADELAITASAVGKRIAALEELLGVALFQRGAKTLTLSAVGKEYLVQVRSALALLASMPLHQRAEQRKQKLRLSAPPTFARQVLVPALPEFAERHPSIELEVVLSVPFLDLAGADAEVAVRHGPIDADTPPPLWRDHLVPLASLALLEGEALRGPADLARLPLLRTPVDPWLPWFRAQGLDWPEPDAGPRLVDLGLVLEAARCGQGVVLARPALARQWLHSGELRPVFGPGQTPMVPSDTAYHLTHTPTPSPAAEALDAWLRDLGARVAAEGLALVSATA
ncbi:LysR substrate-binding domain-containing protein [Ideonella sp. DXS29W]|uniref:LysR substrate-binding domain-containing protein n=1 Tax=Ideonella lacteola TaxID=2984193 RepID=A0ABU9BRI7_9BURK